MPHIRLNEAEIFYDEFGSGDPLLLIHGMLETGRTHARLALTLSNHYRVIVPDLRGYGRSHPRPRLFPPDFYARDAADMAGLLQALDIVRARVVGVADGGEVALLLAAQYPAQVQALVALSVTGAFPPALLDVLPAIGSWVQDASGRYMSWRNEVIREYGLEETQAIYTRWKEAVRTIVAAGGNINLAQVPAIRCPVLIVNGANDELNTAAMSEALAAAIPDAELEMVPDVGQLINDKYRRLFTTKVVNWLTAH